MTDEASTLETKPEAATPTDEGADGQDKKDKLSQTVDIKEIGPCKKHIKVTVARSNIDKLFDEQYKELVGDAWVPGFRPGKAPREVVVRKFKKDVTDRVKGQVLLASLEQLADENDVAPLAPPNINPANIDIPKEGDFVYEFEVEVRPEFTLPDYKGLQLKRPTREITDADVAKEERRILARYGSLVPKPEGNAERGDYLICDMTTKLGDTVIGNAKEITLRVDDTLAFKDGVARNFAEQTLGANAGDKKVVDIELTQAAQHEYMRGQKVQATLEVKDIKKLRLPELTHEFLHTFGVHSEEQLHEQVRILLERRLLYQQRQSAREQILQLLIGDKEFQLPRDLLIRQAQRSFSRRIMEMREMGMPDDEIAGRQRMLEQDVIASTTQSLKEHFVLQKIAELEKIDVEDDDIDAEIEALADQNNDSPRRVRAQLEREDLMETLAAQLIERKALDLILDAATFEEVPMAAEGGISSVEQQATEGELANPTAAPAEEKKPEDQPQG